MMYRSPTLPTAQRTHWQTDCRGYHPPLIFPHTVLRGGDSAGGSPGFGHAGKASLKGMLIVFLLVLLTSLFYCGARPEPALAQAAYLNNGQKVDIDEEGKITGTAHVVLEHLGADGTTTFLVTMPDGQELGARCITPNHYVPRDGDYGFTATPRGDGTYDVVVWSHVSAGPDGAPPDDVHLPPQDVGNFTWKPDLGGWLDFTKVSAQVSINNANECYSLGGAVYGVYRDRDCTVEVARFTTDEQGKASTMRLAAGLYYIKEIEPPRGFALNEDVYTVPFSANDSRTLTIREMPIYAIPTLLLDKVDADTGVASAQGSASLEGAEYRMCHYSGIHNLDDLPENPLYTVTLRSDSQGRILFDDEHLVSGRMPTSLQGKTVLPLGTYVFEEVTPPTGYQSTSPTRLITHVTQESTAELQSTYVPVHDHEQVIRGGVVVQKRDAESHATSPLGSGSFAGISFQIVNRSANAVIVDGTSFAPGQVCATIVTDEYGMAQTAADALPYGRYEIRETGHGSGYFGNTSWSQTFDVTEQGELVDLCAQGTAVEDQVRRGDLSFSKHDAASGALMPYVPFLLTSNSTGEAHVVMTDENGLFTTAASLNPHSQRTNANDAALVEGADGSLSVNESLLDPEAGVWFGQATLDDGSTRITSANDGLGALPYDRVADGGGYTLLELPCAANVGHRMIQTTLSITRDGVELDLGTFDDKPVSIQTTLLSADGNHATAASGSVTLTDIVRYEGLLPGTTHTLQGELHAFDSTGEDLGVVAVSQVDFVPELESGETTVDFVFDASELEGSKVVAFETLSVGGSVWATHADADDESQTVWFPTVQTQASGIETSGKDATATPEAGVVDVVSYEGLLPGDDYELHASLHLLGEDGSDEGIVAEGVEYFDATSEQGSVRVSMEGVDLRPYAGRDLVVCEQLIRDGVVWANHEDLASRDQTVMVPSIRTRATSTRADDVVTTSADEQIVDYVSFANLLPQTDYELTASVHLVEEVDGELVDAGVVARSSTVPFSTQAADEGRDTVSGEVEVPIPIDLSKLHGQHLVVFETLTRGSVTVATHEDLGDGEQTLFVPAIRTTATHEGEHDAFATTGQTIIDEVRYEHLVPGVSYSLSGSLMGIAAGNGDVQLIATSTMDFTPSEPNGTVQMTFANVDLTGLEGGKAVVYEVLSVGDQIVVAHQNPDDESQTIHVPRIRTEAHSAAGTHTALAGPDQVITDTIYYEGLLPEHTYTATATLRPVQVELLGQLSAGDPLSDPTTVSFTTPAAPEGQAVVSGSVEVPIHAYLSDVAGRDVVCFEQLRRGELLVATHEDASDAAQTIHVPTLATRAEAATPNKQGVVLLTDRVNYENLMPGESYEVVGTLHRKSPSGEDLGALKGSDGTPLSVRTTFVAQEAKGSVDVVFDLNVSSLGLAGESVVVFEELRQHDVIVARHCEIGSVDQLVVFDRKGTPRTTGPIPQTGLNPLPYLLVIALAFAALGSGMAASRRYE